MCPNHPMWYGLNFRGEELNKAFVPSYSPRRTEGKFALAVVGPTRAAVSGEKLPCLSSPCTHRMWECVFRDFSGKSFYMQSQVQALARGAGHVACKTSAVGSRSDCSSHTSSHFHNHGLCTVHLVCLLFTHQPEGELLRVHEKCTHKIKVSHFSF
jgi:hypothetical protein